MLPVCPWATDNFLLHIKGKEIKGSILAGKQYLLRCFRQRKNGKIPLKMRLYLFFFSPVDQWILPPNFASVDIFVSGSSKLCCTKVGISLFAVSNAWLI
jgi:hypothetical protein